MANVLLSLNKGPIDVAAFCGLDKHEFVEFVKSCSGEKILIISDTKIELNSDFVKGIGAEKYFDLRRTEKAKEEKKGDGITELLEHERKIMFISDFNYLDWKQAWLK